VDLAEVKRGVRVISGNAGVTVVGAGGDTFVKTSFDLVRAERVAGVLTVENTNGAVKATSVVGAANVKTSFAPVVLSGIGGSVDVYNQNGSIEVAGTADAKGCRNVALETSFSPIRVAVASEAGYTVTARTSFGKITSDLPLTVTGVVSGEALSGRIGTGECMLRLTNSNGAIQIVGDRPQR
jgi:hypothetical protein